MMLVQTIRASRESPTAPIAPLTPHRVNDYDTPTIGQTASMVKKTTPAPSTGNSYLDDYKNRAPRGTRRRRTAV